MNKFYTALASVALVATTASAAKFAPNTNRFNFETTPAINATQLNATPSERVLTPKAEAAIKKNKAQSKLPSLTKVPDISGQCIMTYTLDASQGEFEDEESAVYQSSVTTLEKQSDGTYLVKGFLSSYFGDDVNDLTATFAYNSKYDCFLLDIDAAQTLCTYNGIDYNLYFYGLYSDGKWYYYTEQPLEFYYDEETGELVWAYQDSSIIYLYQYNGKYYGEEVTDCTIDPVNSVMTGTEYFYDEATSGYITEETSYPMWSYYFEDYSTYAFAQFGELPNMIYLYYDKATGTAYAQNQVGFTYYSSQTQKFYDLTVFSEDDDETLLGYVTNNEDGTTTIDFPTGWICYNETTGWIAYFQSAKITINASTDNSGISNVAVDNSNAPVEYYNIQGMRINNPEAGQLVIKRQGTSVSKQIIR